VLEAENTVITERDVTGHAELNLVRSAGKQFDGAALQGLTLYASTEPCAMCSSAIYWSGIGRVVYALGSEGLMAIVNDLSGSGTLALSCSEVLARGRREVEGWADPISKRRQGPYTRVLEPTAALVRADSLEL
jgi:tRNA(Arg) A34 adenosine deaminase TadA